MKPIKHPYSYRQRINFLAYETIRGSFGNGNRRKRKLGKLYKPVQARVDEIYKEAGRYPVIGSGRIK